MANSSPPWAAYLALMACRLVDLGKSPGVRPVGLEETLFWDLAKLVMRAAGYQANTACGNLQLCAGLDAGIERAIHDVGQWRLERSRQRHREEEAIRTVEEDETESVVVGIENIHIDTAGTEEEAAKGLKAALRMEIKEEGEIEGEGEREEGVDGTLRALVDLEFLTQDTEPRRTTLVHARNGFNKLSRLAMLWSVRHRWPAGGVWRQ